LEKGEAIGLEKGIAQGIAQTLAHIVIASKHNGLSVEQIESITHLTAEQINAILMPP
jgi:predicted transposase YdaD